MYETKAGSSSLGYAEPPRYPQTEPSGAPLSVDVMSRMRTMLDQAQAVNARFYDLRNRLFGEMANAQNGAGRPISDTNSFSGAFREIATDLHSTIESIDALSSELAGRF